MNIDEIKKILPHREPMLLIEEAYSEGEGKAVAYYTVKGDEFFLQGHFPGNPIVPGVIQCEMMAQASCVLLRDKMTGEDILPLYTGLKNVRFKNQVKSGDRVRMDVELIESRPPFYFLKGRLSVDEKTVMQGEFSCAIVEAQKEGN